MIRIGVYPPGTTFRLRGGKEDPTIMVEMPKLDEETNVLPTNKISKVKKFLELKDLFQDVYNPHNYRILKGEAYFIDVEVFPLVSS